MKNTWCYFVGILGALALSGCNEDEFFNQSESSEQLQAPVITDVIIDGIPVSGGKLTSTVSCLSCVNYNYDWQINGLTVSNEEVYTYKKEDYPFDRITLTVIGYNKLGVSDKYTAQYEIKPRVITSIGYTFDLKNIGLLYYDGNFKTVGDSAEKTHTNIKSVVNDSYGFILIDNDDVAINVPLTGGYANFVSSENNGIKKIVRTGNTKAALKTNGDVIVAGSSIPNEVKPYLVGVDSIINSFWGFAAINSHGDAVSWLSDNGGSMYNQTATPNTNPELSGMKELFSTGHDWYGIKTDGSMAFWGAKVSAGCFECVDFDDVKGKITNATKFAYTQAYSGIALNADGSAIVWGNPDNGGVSPFNKELLENVIDISSRDNSLMALKSTGDFFIWGRLGALTDVAEHFTNIKSFATSSTSVAMLNKNNGVDVYGNSNTGGDVSSVKDHLSSNVIDILGSPYGFVARKNDNSIVTWGAFDIAPPSSIINDVVSIDRVWGLWVATKADGSVVSWGSNRVKGRADIENGLSYKLQKLN